MLLSIGGMVVVAAFLGYRLGQMGPPTETAVINAAADAYASETGGVRTSCVAVPGQGTVWIEVRCGPDNAPWLRSYDRQGREITGAVEG